ncbi:unnamed protein product [Polarella glacialis]|uniref:Amidohydrolase-related domain-containing protein n=1 Tax=Polarella glacialis TaxID=89957 RepID=A0A813LD41_POLGL|nr:unnamed protein product [Polarella glacialis]|mmetsp:Transcript_36069/g.58202  ORF Transcript_36069/g.58202 Transcript_36069/m.58202 type:complete len:477 (-) Transcript_36069:226-1656(-)
MRPQVMSTRLVLCWLCGAKVSFFALAEEAALQQQCVSGGCESELDMSSDASWLIQLPIAKDMLPKKASFAGENGSVVQNTSSSPAPAPVEHPIQGTLTLDHFRQHGSGECYSRASRNQWAVVDAHLHTRPFGGPPVPIKELIGRLQRAGVLFASMYGIGQRLPIDSPCTYYLDCPGTPIRSSLKNDFWNAQEVLDNAETLNTSLGPHLTLSMSFLNLSEPESVLSNIELLDKEFPNLFHQMGELNVVKQALFKNDAGLPVPIEKIKEWGPFMQVAKERGLPIGFHSDLGNDKDAKKYLSLIDEILRLYPENKIIWLHLGGLSKQLDPLAAALLSIPIYVPEHIKLLEERLEQHQNLMIDLSWDVLYDDLFKDPAKRDDYVSLFNKYPTRFIPGSDHVAAASKTEEGWHAELERTNDIYRSLSDDAFRRIALGQNYIELLGLKYTAPQLCSGAAPRSRLLQGGSAVFVGLVELWLLL